MFNKQAFLKRKYFYISGILILFILLMGIFEPVILNNYSGRWGDNLNSKIAGIKTGLQNYFSDEERRLLKDALSLSGELSSEDTLEHFSDDVRSAKWNDYSIAVFNPSGKRIAGNNINGSAAVFYFLLRKQQSMFYLQTELFNYLSLYTAFNYKGEKYFLLINKPVDKKYLLNTSYFKAISLKDRLSKTYQVNIEIYGGDIDAAPRDGREQCAEVYNASGDKLLSVVFENPSLSAELNKKREFISFLQIFCFLLLAAAAIVKLFNFLGKINRYGIKAAALVAVVILIRILLFIFDIPSRFIEGDLTDASYFSSAFGYGIVSSPLDLFLTVISILCILIIVYDFARSAGVEYFTGGKAFRITVIIILAAVYFLLLRAFGASIRSVIYDSTLKYFKDPFIIPNLPLFVMHLNVLLIGLSALLFAISLLLLMFKFAGEANKNRMLSAFFLLQAAGLLYDLYQADPQGNHLTRVLYIILSFASALWVRQNSKRTVFEYSVYLIFASFLSILLLNYYNRKLEKDSLPSTAQEILKNNEKLNEFMAIQATVQFSKESELIETVKNGGYNYNALVFKLWSKSVLPKEILSSHVSVLNKELSEIGHYDYNFESHPQIEWDINSGAEYKVKNIEDPYTGKKLFITLAPIKEDKTTLGYVELALCPINNYFDRKQCYNILSSYNQRLNSTVDISQLKLFLVENGNIRNTIGDISLNDTDIKYFRERIKKEGDGIYVEREIEGKPHLIFIRRSAPVSGEGILGVALRKRDLTIDLFDFFKVFFIHSIIIVIFSLLVFLVRIKKMWKTLFNFRTRLLYTLIIIAIVPLFLSAAYFKSLVEEKNREDINNKLSKMAVQVGSYLRAYSTNSSLNETGTCNKAHQDLGIDYSLFSGEKMIYTTTEGFYKSTLLPEELNAFVKEKLIGSEGGRVLLAEKIDDYEFNSVYYKSGLNGNEIIINVNNAFNEITLSLSNLEVDIFLFGAYSFAAVIIILLSSILSGQISKPIRILTKATSAVAEGDLDVRVEYKDKGEINNLFVGFNEMVRKLKKSRSDQAEFERETAWKEMARQVAHEIKNPLTPMKLSIQQLIASYNDKSPKFNDIFEKVTSTIIGQIETLNKIASEFSSFARMPKMKIEKAELNKICSEAVYLFESDLRIKVLSPQEPILIMADPDHLKRSIINLIRNSIQANAKHLEIKIVETADNAEIRLLDDGDGIAKENIDKIFDENFTTKEKGMGLGLSMARKYFESVNGSIKVVSVSEKGTEFLIVMPKAGTI